jgi:hypothetical protein
MQQPSAADQTSPSASQDASAAGGNSVEGCLGGSAGKFTIIDKAGTTYDLQLPAGADSSKLNSHIGQEIRATGTMSNAKDSGSNASAASSTSASGAAGASGSHPSIAVTKIDKIADTCSTNTTASPK